ncbi:MAG: fumarylacetoacetase [Bacteroidota bacterium]
MSDANSPQLTSWVPVPENSDFPIQNLPFGVCRTSGGPHIVVAIGDLMLDLHVLADSGLLNASGVPREFFQAPLLNPLAALGRSAVTSVRNRVSELLRKDNAELQNNPDLNQRAFLPRIGAELLLPVFVGDYTDFYSSREHATNVGSMFRDPNNALLPNWLHIPVGYHGRASSVVVSGTPIRRPNGQTKPNDDAPVYGPSRLLDFELEMAFVCGQPNKLGHPIAVDQAEDHIFGMVLFNDWSARDIQKWEYVPLGPFLGKNFASSVSPWVVTLDALEPFRIAAPEQDPAPLPYLQSASNSGFDIQLEVAIAPQGGEEFTVCRSNYRNMYWTMRQQLAHHTVNGCNINAGDMCASGTISGPTPDSYGSMLELSWRGTKPIQMPDGSERKFLQDGDTVVMRGYCEKDGVRIGFGEVRGEVLPALT